LKLEVVFESERYQLDVSPYETKCAQPMFEKMDRDMDSGWQMGVEYVEHLGPVQRAQIAANRLMIALEQQNEPLALAMAGYILKKVPNAVSINIDTTGEPQLTEIHTRDGP